MASESEPQGCRAASRVRAGGEQEGRNLSNKSLAYCISKPPDAPLLCEETKFRLSMIWEQ